MVSPPLPYLKCMKILVTRCPDKNFGNPDFNELYIGALLATDYKSPPWVVEVNEETDSDQHDR